MTKMKLVMVIAEGFDKSHYLCNFHIFGYYFVFLWLKFKGAEYNGSLT